MKKYIVLLVIALLVLLVATNTSYEQQSVVPELKTLLKDEPFKDVLSHIEFTYGDKVYSIEARGYYLFVEFFIRKATHLFGYGFIGLMLFLLYSKKLKRPVLWSIVSAAILAALDEYNQSKTPGRLGMVEDVLLDVLGAVLFVGLASLVQQFKTKKK